jgi:hypothetical protein
MNEVTAFSMGEAHFKECQLVHDFLNARVRPRVVQAASSAPNAESETFVGVLLRGIAWLRTLGKLNEPADFQAGIVASRTLFEIGVDATLMHLDPTNPAAKMLAWEDSARLKAASKLQEYFRRKGEMPTHEFDSPIDFIAANRARVEALRVTHWPGPQGNGRHPPRWTGRDLGVDAAAATQLFSDGDFEAFYETRYPQICWNTHGSSLAGVRSITPEMFPGLSALAFQESTHFALVAAEIILRRFGLWDAEVAVEFDDHSSHRTALKYETIAGAR